MQNNNDYGIIESISKGVACGLLSFYVGDEIAVYYSEGITAEEQQCVRHAARKEGRFHYDYFLPFRLIKKVGIKRTLQLWIQLRAKKLPLPIPHVKDSYVVCSELGQESYLSCKIPMLGDAYTLIPDDVPLLPKVRLRWRGKWSLQGCGVEFQPADIVLVHSRGFNWLRFITGMYWNHLLIIDEKI